jgi:4-amino-4-deoxy-L-arabinose transferase-like glycosyltransferase
MWLRSPVIFLAALLVAGVFWVILPAGVRDTRSIDYQQAYEPVARSIAAGHGIRHEDGQVATYYPPGYSLLLAGVMKMAQALHVPYGGLVQIMALIAHALTVLILFHLAADVWGRRWALLPAVLWTTYPLALWFVPLLNSEVAFAPFFYGALLVFWRQMRGAKLSRWQCLLAGMGMGMAMLIRPIAIAGAILLAALLGWRRREIPWRQRQTAMAALLLGNLIVIAPWQIWVYRQTGQIIALSSGGKASMIDGLTFALPDDQRPGVTVPEDVRQLMLDCQGAAVGGQLKSIGQVFAWVGHQARHRPAAMAKLAALKAARAFYATDSHRHEREILILQAPYLLTGLLGALLARRRSGAAAQLANISMLFVIYFWAMTVLVLSIVRYTVPGMPLLMLLTPAVGIALAAQWRRRVAIPGSGWIAATR